MPYIEGYVMSVPTKNRDAYRAYCENFARIFKRIGGSRLVECWGDDIPDGKHTDFKRAAQLRADETTVFSWMEFPDRQTRDAVFRQMRSDPEIVKAIASDLYDRTRMFHTGFEIVSEQGSRRKFGYLDATLIPVPSERSAEYIDWTSKADAIFLKAGATRVIDALSEELSAGSIAEFRQAVAAKDDEKVGFGWIEWPSKQARDEAWKNVMAGDEMKALGMPFDGQRMIFGGFEPLIVA